MTEEVLTGFSLSVSPGTANAAPTVVVTATTHVDSVSAGELLLATLEDTVYESALITPHNLATDLSYELGGPSVTAQLLQAGASGELVQVVIAAKSLQVVVAPKFGGRGWTAKAVQFEGQDGQRYTYQCPAAIEEVTGPSDNVSGDNVWGTTTYTDDSSVCAAAVNYGLITIEAGGTVTIEIEPGLHCKPGLNCYQASNRNGTTTESYGSWSGSFVFIGQPIYNTDVGYGDSGWDATAGTFGTDTGQRYLYICPPGGSAGEVWGTGTYTYDSSVCTAAVQEGLITLKKGGDVTIQIGSEANSYTGSTKNGITSSDWSGYCPSYTFVTTLQPVASTLGPLQARTSQVLRRVTAALEPSVTDR